MYIVYYAGTERFARWRRFGEWKTIETARKHFNELTYEGWRVQLFEEDEYGRKNFICGFGI